MRPIRAIVSDLRCVAGSRFGYAKFDLRSLCAEAADRLEAMDARDGDVVVFLQEYPTEAELT